MASVEKVNQYRQKHKRCRTCRHAVLLNRNYIRKAKNKNIGTIPSIGNTIGMFCKLYESEAFKG